MTQALNLANFANKLNSSGQTDNTGLQNSSVTVTAGTGLSGGGAVALGSSVTLNNAGVTSLTAGTGITLSGSTGGVTINATGTGTVTSVATGNGLQGGTITSSGTLSVACPSVNTVGSYGFLQQTPGTGNIDPGSTKAGNLTFAGYDTGNGVWNSGVSASGTWRCMGYSPASATGGFVVVTVWCRVS